MQGFSAPRARALLFRLLFWAALALTLVMALLPHPPRVAPTGLWDKWQHMAAFATLALTAALGYRRVPLPRLAEHLSFLGALIEVLQAMPPIARDCDIFDWIADTLAIAIVLGLVGWWRRRAG